MRFRALDARTSEGRDAWLRLWRAAGQGEAMAHPEYAAMFARPCDRVVAVAGEDAEGTILFPLLLRPLAVEPWARPGERRWDATSPYGYGGPFATGVTPRFDTQAFWRAHAEWCGDERVVSTFVRLSLFPGQLAPMPWRITSPMANVVVALGGGIDAVWRGYHSNVRRYVRRAERSGVVVEQDRAGARLREFHDVYTETMRRVGASPWYHFPLSFFERFVERLPGLHEYFYAVADGRVLSCELTVVSADHVYAFLGGTVREGFALGPNHLLKHRIAEWAIAHGKRYYVLGGGNGPADRLLEFKRGFGGLAPFRIAMAVHDEEAFRQLSSDRADFEAGEGRERAPPDASFFPAYRA